MLRQHGQRRVAQHVARTARRAVVDHHVDRPETIERPRRVPTIRLPTDLDRLERRVDHSRVVVETVLRDQRAGPLRVHRVVLEGDHLTAPEPLQRVGRDQRGHARSGLDNQLGLLVRDQSRQEQRAVRCDRVALHRGQWLARRQLVCELE